MPRITTFAVLAASHTVVAIAGFAGGIYALPIMIAPASPSIETTRKAASEALYTGRFTRDLKDSDALHWGEGEVSIGADQIAFTGRLAPGPDYKLYLSPEFVETEVDFNRLKSRMARVGDVKTFNNFLVKVPPGINPSNYTTVIVWCETFSEFITSARYK